LIVSAAGYSRGCAVVKFQREDGFVAYCCFVDPKAGRNEAYLRSLVNFMQHKVHRS